MSSHFISIDWLILFLHPIHTNRASTMFNFLGFSDEYKQTACLLRSWQSTGGDKHEWNHQPDAYTSAWVINACSVVFKGSIGPRCACNETSLRKWCLNWDLKDDGCQVGWKLRKSKRAQWAAGIAAMWREGQPCWGGTEESVGRMGLRRQP